MRYFVDSEFYTIKLPSAREVLTVTEWLSLGVVAEDGRELYLERAVKFSGSDERQLSPFVRDVVLPKRTRTDQVSSSDARNRLLGFIGSDVPEFWGDYAAFDYVILSQIMGTFEQWPAGWPMFFRDLQQMRADFKLPEPPAGDPAKAHHALNDARLVRDHFKWLRDRWESSLPETEEGEDPDYTSPDWRFGDQFDSRHKMVPLLSEWVKALEAQTAPVIRIFGSPKHPLPTIDGVVDLTAIGEMERGAEVQVYWGYSKEGEPR